jgi:hypothetical protein
LAYCSKHRQYYRADVGCQLCGYERLNLGQSQDGESPSLEKCPECGQTSLFWNKGDNLHKCLNPKCRRAFTDETLASAREEEAQPKESKKADLPMPATGDEREQTTRSESLLKGLLLSL